MKYFFIFSPNDETRRSDSCGSNSSFSNLRLMSRRVSIPTDSSIHLKLSKWKFSNLPNKIFTEFKLTRKAFSLKSRRDKMSIDCWKSRSDQFDRLVLQQIFAWCKNKFIFSNKLKINLYTKILWTRFYSIFQLRWKLWILKLFVLNLNLFARSQEFKITSIHVNMSIWEFQTLELIILFSWEKKYLPYIPFNPLISYLNYLFFNDDKSTEFHIYFTYFLEPKI